MNIWTFTGNLGRDSEQKYTSAGMAVLSFTVAVKSGYGDKAKTTWVSCALFGKQAEGRLVEFLKKGTQVCVSGEAYLDEWEKDGITNKMLKVNVNNIDLIGGKADGQQSNQHQQSNQGQQRPAQAPQQHRPQHAQRPQQYSQQQNQGQQYQHPQQQNNSQPPLEDGWDSDIPF